MSHTLIVDETDYLEYELYDEICEDSCLMIGVAGPEVYTIDLNEHNVRVESTSPVQEMRNYVEHLLWEFEFDADFIN